MKPQFIRSKTGFFVVLLSVVFCLGCGQNKDEAKSFGFQFVQDFSKWGTECYLGYRNYDLDRSGTDFNDIDALMSGVRVKF